jgi:hypothetical protein
MMDTTQMFERLLATMKANQEDLLARWEAKMDTTLTIMKEEKCKPEFTPCGLS